MNILVEVGETATRIGAEGEVDLNVAGELKNALIRALEASRGVTLDLRRATGIDLSCTQLLLAASREFRVAGYSFTMEDPVGTLAAVLSEYGFEEPQ